MHGNRLIDINKTKRGPNIDPFGSPYITDSKFDLNLFIDTSCFLFCKYECNGLLVTQRMQ